MVGSSMSRFPKVRVAEDAVGEGTEVAEKKKRVMAKNVATDEVPVARPPIPGNEEVREEAIFFKAVTMLILH